MGNLPVRFKKGPQDSLPEEFDEGTVLIATDTGGMYLGQGYELPLLPLGGTDLLPDDTSGAPGGQFLVAGNKQAGYFGEVSVDLLMSGTALCAAIGLSGGSAQNSTVNWLKFSFQNKILFVNRKTIRRNLSWGSIYQAGAVYGTGQEISAREQWMLENDPNYSLANRVPQGAQVAINGLTYKVRLLKGLAGATSDSFQDDLGALGPENEWNALMLPIHEHAPNNWSYPQYAGITSNWEIGFSNESLLTHNAHGNGAYTLCQEAGDISPSARIGRGYEGVSSLLLEPPANITRGLRFVLELID